MKERGVMGLELSTASVDNFFRVIRSFSLGKAEDGRIEVHANVANTPEDRAKLASALRQAADGISGETSR